MGEAFTALRSFPKNIVSLVRNSDLVANVRCAAGFGNVLPAFGIEALNEGDVLHGACSSTRHAF